MKIVLVALLAIAVNWPFAGIGMSGMDDLAVLQGRNPRRSLTNLTYDFDPTLKTNIALHAAASAAAAWAFSPVAGTLLAVHPMTVDAVHSVAGRSSLLCALFVLLSAAMAMRKSWVACLAFGIVACLAKEEGIALVIIVPLIVGRVAFAPFALAAALLLPAGIRAAGSGVIVPNLWMAGMPTPVGVWEYAASYLSGIANHIGLNAAAPLWLSADPLITSAWWPLGLLMIIGLGRLALSRPAAALALGSVLIYLPAMLPDPILEHRYYLFLIGASGLAASMLPRSVAIALCGLLAVGTMHRAIAYQKPESLWADADAKSNGAYRARINHAMVLAMNGNLNSAERLYRTLPRTPFIRRQLATLQLARGDMAAATRELDENNSQRARRILYEELERYR